MNISTLDIDELGKGRIVSKIVTQWNREIEELFNMLNVFEVERQKNFAYLEGTKWTQGQIETIAIRKPYEGEIYH